MAASDTIGVGFIGAGDISILHAAAVKKCPGAKLVGLWNRSPGPGQAAGRRVRVQELRDPRGARQRPGHPRRVRLTNLETHLEYTKLALDAGKHVLVEKPVGVSVGRDRGDEGAWPTRRSSSACRATTTSTKPSMNRTRELVEAGDLGRIVSCYVMYNIHHPEEVAKRYPGVVRQILTHNSYILLYLVGKPKSSSAR